MNKFSDQLVDMLVKASGECFKSLFKNHNERFYYCSLIMPEDSSPFISAWSFEALERVINKFETGNTEELRRMYKWSYADSPYCAYGYKDYFLKIQALFQKRRSYIRSGSDYVSENILWLDSMEKAMNILDKSGLFGSIVINAEIMPPDSSNTERALRLNPTDALTDWIKECSEEDFFDDPEEDSRLCDVIITKPILDKKEIMKIKREFSYTNSISLLFKGASCPPFKLKSSMNYKDAVYVLSKFPELKDYINIIII